MPTREVRTIQRLGVPLEWRVPEDLETHFATNVVISHSEAEFFLTFFEVVPPPIMGDLDSLRALKSVPAHAVARIVVAADRMEGIIKAMSQNLENYRKMKALEKGEPV